MKTLLCWISALGLLAAGCGRNAPPPVVSIEKAPAALEQTYSAAKPELKTIATDLAQSVKGKDYASAFTQAQILSDQPGLSREQQTVATQTRMSVLQELMAAEANGDPTAAAILKRYRQTK